jgi:hypothetical protein
VRERERERKRESERERGKAREGWKLVIVWSWIKFRVQASYSVLLTGSCTPEGIGYIIRWLGNQVQKVVDRSQ